MEVAPLLGWYVPAGQASSLSLHRSHVLSQKWPALQSRQPHVKAQLLSSEHRPAPQACTSVTCSMVARVSMMALPSAGGAASSVFSGSEVVVLVALPGGSRTALLPFLDRWGWRGVIVRVWLSGWSSSRRRCPIIAPKVLFERPVTLFCATKMMIMSHDCQKSRLLARE